MSTSGFGVIHGVPSAAPEVTDVITRLKEKHAEEAIRAIWKQGVKDGKARDTSENDVDSDSERKSNQELNDMKRENKRLLTICQNKGIDTRTRREKASDEKRLPSGEHQRSESQRGERQRGARTSRSDAVRKPDNAEGVARDEDNDLATHT